MTSEDITLVQKAKGHDAGARPCRGLTEAQKTGHACIVCGQPDATEHLGYVAGTSVKIHKQCVEPWRNGEGPPRS
jgi:hypothetical protein